MTGSGDDRSDGGLPVVAPPFDGGAPDRRAATVHGVVLAAGTSSRYGDANKLLAGLDGEPLVRHAARGLLAADVDGVTVVVGHEADRVREAVADLDLAVVVNPDYGDGQATSVRRGVLAAREADADAAVFALGDMPAVGSDAVDALVAAYRAGVGDALAAAADGERGNPVLFGSRHFDALADVTGDVGGRDVLLGGDRSALVETGDPGVRRDVDRPGDLDDVG